MSKNEINEKMVAIQNAIRDHKKHISEITRARTATSAYLNKYGFEYQPCDLPLTGLLEEHQKAIETLRDSLGKMRRAAKLKEQLEALNIE